MIEAESTGGQVGAAAENRELRRRIEILKARYDGILRSLSVGIVTAGADGLIDFANGGAGRIMRIDEAGLLGKPFSAMFGEVNGWVLGEIEEVVGTGRRKQLNGVEFAVGDFAAGDGEWAAVDLIIDTLTDGDGALILMEDITREREFRRVVSRYVNDKVADELVESGGTDFAVQMQEASVLMSDIRGFTALTEQQGPRETVDMLNEYFSFMEDVVSNRHGVVDKYIGDALMAVFGTPLSSGRDADNAVRAATDMLMVLKMLNARRKACGKTPLRIGIGIATGAMITGNIGSSKRTSFTHIGDPVNLATRLESLTKTYGADIILCGETTIRLREAPRLRLLDVIRVRGQEKPTQIFEVFPAGDADGVFSALAGRYEAALDAYLKGDFDDALGRFETVLEILPTDRPAERMASRCRRLIAERPSGWDGIWGANSGASRED